jgi:hypothetical protein
MDRYDKGVGMSEGPLRGQRLLRAREHAQRALDELGRAQRSLSDPGREGASAREADHPEAQRVEGKLEAARSVVEGALDELDLLSGVEG